MSPVFYRLILTVPFDKKRCFWFSAWHYRNEGLKKDSLKKFSVSSFIIEKDTLKEDVSMVKILIYAY